MAINTNYEALVSVKISDKKIHEQLKKLSSQEVSVKLKLDSGVAKNLNSINKAINNVSTNANNLGSTTSTAMNKVSSSVQTASKHTKSLGDDFLSTAGKVAKFGAITSMLSTFTRAISEAISVVKEFDDTLTNFRKVSDLSGQELDNYTQKLANMGTEVARTGTEMLASATKFKQSGFSEEESAQLAKIAEMYRNVADAEISSGEASAFIISQMKAFNISSKDSITILDSLNAISNNFAVSSSDVAEGMSKSSASLATYGNTLSESMSLITAG